MLGISFYNLSGKYGQSVLIKEFHWYLVHTSGWKISEPENILYSTLANLQIDTPMLPELRDLQPSELPAYCREVARFIIDTTAEKTSHIESSLAVTELTIALHYCFNTPEDILIWDVGHQAYVHKVVTDRKERFHTNRKKGGISGFTSRNESPFDPFGAGHSSTSISAIGGFAQAAEMNRIKRKHIAVIGDGALTGGMAFEALNHLGTSGLDILLILNDNESSIDSSIGSLHEFQNYKEYFESLGWGYSGPKNGHDLPTLHKAFQAEKTHSGTRVLHVKTKRKRLTQWQEELGLMPKRTNLKSPGNLRYQDFFAEKLIDLAKADERIVAVTPAMLSGSSLNTFQQVFPNRTFDVGIAEQHAVTFAAGLAASGMKPLVHLYSTFAQRAYDQIIHDVALQNLPVVFALDRAGLVGEDGATHHGAFDLSFLNPIPNIQVLAPMTGAELQRMLAYAFTQNGPVAIRYPRGSEKPFPLDASKVETGSFRLLKEGGDICVVSLGTTGVAVEKALLEIPGLQIGHIDLRFLKPWNDAELKKALEHYGTIITIEDGSLRGGLRDSMAAWIAENKWNTQLIGIGLEDKFIAHGTPQELASEVGLSNSHIHKTLQALLKESNLKLQH